MQAGLNLSYSRYALSYLLVCSRFVSVFLLVNFDLSAVL